MCQGTEIESLRGQLQDKETELQVLRTEKEAEIRALQSQLEEQHGKVGQDGNHLGELHSSKIVLPTISEFCRVLCAIKMRQSVVIETYIYCG